MTIRRFTSFACFDWSGQAVARPRGIALGLVEGDAPPRLVRPDGGWSRQGALDWLENQATASADMLIGMDVSAGFPFVDQGTYFPGWEQSPPVAKSLWRLVDEICAKDDHLAANSFVRHPQAGRYFRHGGLLGDRYGEQRAGRLRTVEIESRKQGLANPYSSLNLVGAAQVGKSSLTAMRLLHRLGGRIPVWPFDPVPRHGPMIVEIYTSIAAVQSGLRRGRTKMRDRDSLMAAMSAHGHDRLSHEGPLDDHGCDALLTACWLARASRNPDYWHPAKMTAEIACTEGWTFGVA